MAKLNDIKSTLIEKHKSHSSMIGFFENNADCPTCEQHIDENFKEDMISKKQDDANKVMTGLKDLETELVKSNERLTSIKNIVKNVRDNEVQIAKDKSGVNQLERFNKTLKD